MELVAFLTTLCGAILLLYSRRLEKKEAKKQLKAVTEEKKEVVNQIKEQEALMEELNGKFLELNAYYEYVSNEIEKKYKELIFVYGLVQEKQAQREENNRRDSAIQEAVNHSGTVGLSPVPKPEPLYPASMRASARAKAPQLDFQDQMSPQAQQRNVAHVQEQKAVEDRRKQILTMSKKGKSVDEIAKTLQIGKGEVKLILDLFK